MCVWNVRQAQFFFKFPNRPVLTASISQSVRLFECKTNIRQRDRRSQTDRQTDIVGADQYRPFLCIVLPRDDCEPSQSSVVARDQQDGGSDSAARLLTARTAVTSSGNDLVVIVAAVTATLFCLVALLIAVCYWRRRRCIAVLSKHCWVECS